LTLLLGILAKKSLQSGQRVLEVSYFCSNKLLLSAVDDELITTPLALESAGT
jgi:hypothetical protein